MFKRVKKEEYISSNEFFLLFQRYMRDEITFEGDVLTIKGDLPAPLGNVDYVTQERVYGPFVRRVNVRTPVQADKIEATFEHGLLIVTLPKVEEAKPKTVKVKVKK